MKYPKIQTLWKRDMARDGVIIEGMFSRDEFLNIGQWRVLEKLDGMNLGVIYDNRDPDYGSSISFRGRTERATIPLLLQAHLEKTFTLLQS